MSPELIQFIQQHEHDDPAQLVLKQKEILGYPASFVANQIDCRKRAKEKLPTWYANPEIIYPPKQNLEQCSSEATAKFKCDFIRVNSRATTLSGGTTLIDLTGGFGVDSFFFAKIFEKVIHVEPNQALCQLSKENHARLGVNNIEYINQTAESFSRDFADQADWVYIDPSRKNEGKKVVRLTDCDPDVTQLLPSLFSKTNQILIKAAPLLDIKEGLKRLPVTAHVLVVSVGNDCKEVLFHPAKNFPGEPEIRCVNILSNGTEDFVFRFSEEAAIKSAFREPLDFIYEPNASILKAGAFKKIASDFDLFKLAVSTHLYTSHKKVELFPGRVFKILGNLSAQAQLLPEGKANIISRNHPLSPDEIKKKYKLKDGGERYLLAFSGEKKKYMLVAERIR